MRSLLQKKTTLHRAHRDVVSAPHDRRCLACGAETTSRCARCKVVFFCNNDRKCLAAVWAEHKGHCVAVKTP